MLGYNCSLLDLAELGPRQDPATASRLISSPKTGTRPLGIIHGQRHGQQPRNQVDHQGETGCGRMGQAILPAGMRNRHLVNESLGAVVNIPSIQVDDSVHVQTGTRAALSALSPCRDTSRTLEVKVGTLGTLGCLHSTVGSKGGKSPTTSKDKTSETS